MGLCIRHVGEEWLPGLGFALDEVDRMAGDFTVDGRTLGTIIDLMLLGLLASLGGHDAGELNTGILLKAVAIGPECLV